LLWLWLVVAKFPFAVIYLLVISEGLRLSVPPLAQRLGKIPFLSMFRDYEATYRLDLAHIFAVGLLVAVLWLAERALHFYLDPNGAFKDSLWPAETLQRLVPVLCGVILGADLVLFYVGIANSGWGGARLSFTALIATVAYAGVLTFVSFVSLSLKATAQAAERSDS
jgi:hypothetical protein